MPKRKDIHRIVIIGSGMMSLLAVSELASAPQAPDQEKWNTVERTCGKLEWVEKILVKGKVAEFEEKSKPLKKIDVRLYRWENESSCCGTALPIAQALTNKSGVFNFKNVVRGSYWVVVEMSGKQYSHAIKYVPSKDEVSCSDLLYNISNGELQLGRVITVD
jgi:hypothetical protein